MRVCLWMQKYFMLPASASGSFLWVACRMGASSSSAAWLGIIAFLQYWQMSCRSQFVATLTTLNPLHYLFVLCVCFLSPFVVLSYIRDAAKTIPFWTVSSQRFTMKVISIWRLAERSLRICLGGWLCTHFWFFSTTNTHSWLQIFLFQSFFLSERMHHKVNV